MKFTYSIFLALAIFTCHFAMAQAQNSGIKAVAADASTKEALPFASVSLSEKKGEQITIVDGVLASVNG